jgi:predicted nucleic acid-binding protein
MIVVDTNVLAYFYLPGEYTEVAERLYERDPDWTAPVLWRSEFRNILAGYLRRGRLTVEQACEVQHEVEALLSGAEYEPDSTRVLELVHASDCSAYACEFIAVAETLGVPLWTMDGKLLRSFPTLAKALVTSTTRV